MAAQLANLLAEAESAHVVIRVSPFTKGTPAGGLPFILLARKNGPDVLYTETLHQGHVEESAAVVAQAHEKYDRLRAAAMSPEESLAFIHDVMKEYSR